MVIDVIYNGNSIASLKSGETAIVECDGMKMTSDLTITAPAFEDSPLPIEVATEDEMTALLETAEVGAVYKYTGETTDAYENGALYIVEVSLITFTIDGTEYQAEDGMTWTEWCVSDYNNDGYRADSGGSVFSSDSYAISDATTTDVIISGNAYALNTVQTGGAG